MKTYTCDVCLLQRSFSETYWSCCWIPSDADPCEGHPWVYKGYCNFSHLNLECWFFAVFEVILRLGHRPEQLDQLGRTHNRFPRCHTFYSSGVSRESIKPFQILWLMASWETRSQHSLKRYDHVTRSNLMVERQSPLQTDSRRLILNARYA